METQKVIHVDIGAVSFLPEEKLTGIPRVTLSLAHEFAKLGQHDTRNLNLISLLHEDLDVPTDILERFNLHQTPVDVRQGEGTILLLDSYFFKFNFLNKLQPEYRKNYQIVDYVHDILPLITEGLFNFSPFRFKHFINQSCRFSDAIVTPSKKTADDIVKYVLERDEVQVGASLLLAFNPHGADFAAHPFEHSQDTTQQDVPEPYFLAVGTLEIRKNHLFILDAFEMLWAAGVNVNLCFAGRIGWKVEDLLGRLQNHPERNKRLFFFNGPSDEKLAGLYRGACGLVGASLDEGFGLPIVEAAEYGVPLLLSDIAIFGEVAGEHARYFSLDNPAHLADAVERFLEDEGQGVRRENSSLIGQQSWNESAKNLVEIISRDRWYCEIRPDKTVEYF